MERAHSEEFDKLDPSNHVVIFMPEVHVCFGFLILLA